MSTPICKTCGQPMIGELTSSKMSDVNYDNDEWTYTTSDTFTFKCKFCHPDKTIALE